MNDWIEKDGEQSNTWTVGGQRWHGGGTGEEPAWYTTGLAERVDGWVASVGRGRSRLLFFLTLFFFVITGEWKKQKETGEKDVVG